MLTKFDHFPLFVVARSLEKAGSVSKLASSTNIHEGTIYTWLNMEHGPSRASVSSMESYLKQPATRERNERSERPFTPSSAREEMVRKRVFVVRHAISQSSQRILFTETGDGERVFMPPIVTKSAFEKYGSNDILPLETAMDVMAYKDRSGRSDYIAFSVVEKGE